MAIRVSGLISGLDTDSIVQELVSAYSTKKEKYEKAQTKLEWKMDAWKTMNSKIYGFYTSSLSNMRISTAYSLKTSTISDSKAATVTASSSAVNGTQKMKVNKLASSAYMTGGVVKLSDDKNDTGNKKVTGSTALADMGIETGSKIAVNDTEIEITDGMTVNQLISKFKDAGINASFDETTQRFFVNAKTSGSDGEFTLTANNISGLNALQSLGLFATKDVDGNDTAELKKYKDIADGTVTAKDDEQRQVAKAIVKIYGNTYTADNLAADKKTVTDYEAQQALASEYKKYTDIKDSFEKNKARYDELAADLDGNKDKLYKTVTKDDGSTERVQYTDEELAEMKAFIKENNGTDDTDIAQQMADKQAILDAKAAVDEYEELDKTIKDNQSGYDEAVQKLKDNASTYSAAADYVNKDDNKNAYASAKAAIAAADAASKSSDAARISGQDAEIVLNGATFTSSTGTFSINGLSITAMQVTAAGEEVSITTSNDTQGMYNKIKEFLGKYNELIKDMDTAYNAAAAKDYEPLTDDEKKDMSDKEIEKWETKIKDSLLRRDSTLGNTSSSLKILMNTSFEINGKTYSLSSFGINTASYFSADTNEKGCLHIDGDADDATTSGNEDKLMAAINEDPEVVAEFFQKLSTSVYNDLTKRMASSSVSSIYTIYNDKQMSSEYSDYKDMVSKWQEKLEYYEEFYYKKFSAMEKALSKLQSSTSSLSSLLGS